MVVDASAVLAWTLETQRTDAAYTFLANGDDMRFVAPFIFPWETMNILLRLLNKGRIVRDDYLEAVANIENFDIHLDPPMDVSTVEPLAVQEKLSLFDASYLALALEQHFSLASRDAGLLAAAERIGVSTWDLR